MSLEIYFYFSNEIRINVRSQAHVSKICCMCKYTEFKDTYLLSEVQEQTYKGAVVIHIQHTSSA